MRSLRVSVVAGITLLSLMATPSRAFAREIPIPENSCYLKYKDERNSRFILIGAVTAANALVLLFPLMIIGDVFMVPMGVVAGIKGVKFGNMVHLIEQIYKGDGELFDEFVTKIQEARPELSREQIRKMFIAADTKNLLCNQPAREAWLIDIGRPFSTFSDTVELFSKPESELDESVRAAIHSEGTPGDLVRASLEALHPELDSVTALQAYSGAE